MRGCSVSCVLALAIAGICAAVSVPGQAGQATAPRERSGTPPARALPAAQPGAELDPEKQKYIWDMEHISFVLETYFGKRITGSLVRGDAAEALSWFREDFRGEILPAGETAERRACAVTEAVRDGSGPREAVDAAGFVGQLLGYLAGYARVDRVRIQVMFIDRLETSPDRYEVELRLSATGVGTDGRLLEHDSYHPFEFLLSETDDVRNGKPIVARAGVKREIRRSGERPLMEEVTERVGLADLPLADNWKLDVRQTRNHRYQLAVEDYDRDGYPDIAIAATDGRPWLLRSKAGRSFEDVTAKSGLPSADPAGERNARALVAWIDYDNDGYPDLLLGRRLYHNDRGARFVDVSDRAGLSFDRSPFGAAVADFDADGRLDLYVFYQRGFKDRSPGRKRPWVGDPDAGAENHLWHNEGGGRFRDVTVESGASGGPHQTFAVATFFLDEDRYPDLYLANDFGANVLLRNRGDGTFGNVTRSSNTGDFATSMGVTAGDLDNDGTVELYVANMYSKMGRRIVAHVDEQDYPPGIYSLIRGSLAGNRLYRRDPGRPRFQELSEELGVNAVGWAYAPEVIDLDADGWLDLYATTGFLSYARGKPDG